MSKNVTPNEETTKEKVVTKYDLKMQRRAEEKKQAKREEFLSKLTGWLVVLAVFAFVAYFPIRSYMTVNGSYISVGGQNVNRVEYDYQYNITKSNYIDQYGSYMSMFGLDLTGDVSNMMYSDTLTWQDYFDQLTVDNIAKNKALMAEAKAKGFTYDTTADYNQLIKSIDTAAKTNNLSQKQFVANNYGKYATISRLKKFIQDDLYVNAYYDQMADELKPSDAEIQATYDASPADYDSVDYRMITVNAELPTEPTELADPVDESAETDEDAAYKPSDAEVKKAMADAKASAESRKSEVATADLRENNKKNSMNSVIADWLFADGRKAGDTTVLEYTSGNCYYIVRFEKRYLSDAKTKDARIIIVSDGTAQDKLAEWKAGAATEESFAELADKYNDLTVTTAKGGLYEALQESSVPVGMDEWLFADDRKTGDAEAIEVEGDETSYVIYYIGDNLPEWKLGISNTLQSSNINEHLEEIKEPYQVSDPKGYLNYLKVEAAEAAAAESTEE